MDILTKPKACVTYSSVICSPMYKPDMCPNIRLVQIENGYVQKIKTRNCNHNHKSIWLVREESDRNNSFPCDYKPYKRNFVWFTVKRRNCLYNHFISNLKGTINKFIRVYTKIGWTQPHFLQSAYRKLRSYPLGLELGCDSWLRFWLRIW